MARPARSVRRAEGHAHAGRIELEPVKASHIDDVIIPGIYNKLALVDPERYGGPFEAAACALRHVIVAAPGNELMAGDFKNIESVVTPWIAGQTATLDGFTSYFEDPKNPSKDIYCITAGKMLGKSPEDVTESERQMGKVAILAFGFGGGVRALINMALNYQMDIEPLADIVIPTATEEQKAKAFRAWWRAFRLGDDFELECRVYMACDILKQQFRTANSAIDQLRRDVDVAVKAAVAEQSGTMYQRGPVQYLLQPVVPRDRAAERTASAVRRADDEDRRDQGPRRRQAMDQYLRNLLDRARARMGTRPSLERAVRGEHGAGDSERRAPRWDAPGARRHAECSCSSEVPGDPAAGSAHGHFPSCPRRGGAGRAEGQLQQGALPSDPDTASGVGTGPPNCS